MRNIAIALTLLAFATLARADGLPEGWTRDDSHVEAKGFVLFTLPAQTATLQVGPSVRDLGLPADAWMKSYPDTMPDGSSPRVVNAPMSVGLNGDRLHSMSLLASAPATGERYALIVYIVESPGPEYKAGYLYSAAGRELSRDDLKTVTRLLLTEAVPVHDRATPVSTSGGNGVATSPDTTRAKGTAGAGWTPVAMSHVFGEKSYNAVSGLWRFRDDAVWTILDNGLAVRDLTESLGPDEIARLHTSEPERFVRVSEAKELARASRYRPVPAGQTYALSLAQPSSGRAGAGTYSQTRRIELRRDGTFEMSRFVIADTGQDDERTTLSVGEDKEGRRTTASGRYGDVDVTRTGRSSGSDGSLSGNYRVDGLEIELRLDNGDVRRLPFATNGRDALVIGDDYFWNLD